MLINFLLTLNIFYMPNFSNLDFLELQKSFLDFLELQKSLIKMAETYPTYPIPSDFLLYLMDLYAKCSIYNSITNETLRRKEIWSDPTTPKAKEQEFLAYLSDQVRVLQNKIKEGSKNIPDAVLLGVISTLLVKAVAITAAGASGAATGPAVAAGAAVVVRAYAKLQEKESFKQFLPGANSYGDNEEDREKYKDKVKESLKKRIVNDPRKADTKADTFEHFEDYVAKKIIDEIGLNNVFTPTGLAMMVASKSGSSNNCFGFDTRYPLHIGKLSEEWKEIQEKKQKTPTKSPAPSTASLPRLLGGGGRKSKEQNTRTPLK